MEWEQQEREMANGRHGKGVLRLLKRCDGCWVLRNLGEAWVRLVQRNIDGMERSRKDGVLYRMGRSAKR